MSKVDNFLIEDPEQPLEIEFQDNSVLIELCGVRDQNIIFLEDKLGIQITRRGNKLLFSGNFDDQKKAANILKNIYFSLEEGRSFEGNDIIDFILTLLIELRKLRLKYFADHRQLYQRFDIRKDYHNHK